MPEKTTVYTISSGPNFSPRLGTYYNPVDFGSGPVTKKIDLLQCRSIDNPAKLDTDGSGKVILNGYVVADKENWKYFVVTE